MLASTLLAAKAGGKVPAGARRGGMTSAWMKVGGATPKPGTIHPIAAAGGDLPVGLM